VFPVYLLPTHRFDTSLTDDYLEQTYQIFHPYI